MPRPLDGIVVLDFTTMVAGPAATRLLADCGADVIKLENVGDGDLMRGGPNASEMNRLAYGQYNAGKRSVAVDLKSPAGLEAVRRLVARTDVLVENFRPGVMKRLSLDYETLSAVHPRLVYCSVSGFGQKGPLAQRPAYAPVIQAYSGFESVLAEAPELSGRPLDNGAMIADVAAAGNAFAAIQTALLHRERHGVGSHVDVTLVEAMIQLVALQYQRAQAGVEDEPISYPPLKTSDGYVNIPLIAPGLIRTVMQVIGLGDWLEDPALATRDGLMARRDDIITALAEWAAQRTSEECDEAMNRAGVPCGIYRTPRENWSDEHLLSRGVFSPVQDAKGAFKVVNPPFQISGANCEAPPFVASLGEHTREVMLEVAGCTSEEFDALRAGRAFG